MSPHIKRTAIGGCVVALTSLLVLSAIAVAHRDSRDMDAESGPDQPEYASQSVQGVTAPPGMINHDSKPRHFPHADLASDTAREARSAEGGNTATRPRFTLPNEGANEKAELTESPSQVRATPAFARTQQREDTKAFSNPLRIEPRAAEDVSKRAAIEDESPSKIESFASHELPVSTANYEPTQDKIAQPTTDDAQEVAAEDSKVVTASGFDLPPSGSKQESGGALVPPSLPAFSSATGLPPDLKQPSTLKSTTGTANNPTANDSLGAAATLLPPGSALATPSQSLSSAVPGSPAAAPSLPTVNSSPAGTSRSLSNTRELPSMPSLGAPQSSLSSGSDPGRLSTLASPPTFPSNLPNPSDSNAVAGNVPGISAVPRASNPNSTGASLLNREPRGLHTNAPAALSPETTYPSLETQRQPAGNASRGFNDAAAMVPIQSAPATRASLSSMSSAQGATKFVSDRPGERVLDGMQVPNLQILKEAPQEIQVGHPATFTILVKNVGKSAAHEVQVQDVLPQGTTLHASNPQAEVIDGGHLVWNLGTLPAGSQQVLTVEAIPQQEGEIGSVATVQFKAQASVRTVVTQPKLVISQQADPSVLIGEQCRVRITITNDGTGVAYDVKVQEDVPEGFSHPQGDALQLSLNDLAPGQSRTFDLELEAKEPGVKQNNIRVLASNTEEAVSDVNIEVVAPQLAVKADGPSLRYLERQATYTVSVGNSGTAAARNIELKAYLPRGLRFNSAGNQGEYLPDQHAVVWGLEELAANSEAKTDLVVMPVEEGDFVVRFQSHADRATAQPFEKQVRVDGQSELAFTVEDDNDPIEVDGQTTYLIRLNNVGTRRDTNVQVEVELPNGAALVSMSSEVEYQQRQNSIVFNPIAAMNPKDEKVFRFSVKLANEGTQMVRVNVKSDLRPVAVVKEESTQVYSDQ